MGRMYSVFFGGVSKTGPQDLFGIYAGSLALRLRELSINSDNAASNSNLDIDITRFSGTITRGSGGAIVTPGPLRSTDPAASFVAHIADTTQMLGTNVQELITFGANLITGLVYSPDEDICIVLQSGEALTIGSGESAGSNSLFGHVILEELS